LKKKQETQLSLTNRATSVKVTKHCTIRYVRYGFLLLCYTNFVPIFQIFDFKKCHDLEIRVTAHSRSLNMVSLDRSDGAIRWSKRFKIGLAV